MRYPQGTADFVAICDDMAQVGHDDVNRVRKLFGRVVRVDHGCNGIKIAGKYQRGYGGKLHTRRQRFAR